MARKAKTETATTEVPAVKVIAYKGFNSQLACRDHQFEIGKSYEVAGTIAACSNGFHACEYPLSVFEYYPPAQSRFAQVELEGDMDVDGDKTAARKITVIRELTLAEMVSAAISYTNAHVLAADGNTSGKQNGAATASGYQGAATASGDQGAATASGTQGAATASGYQGAATASGDQGAATASGYQGAATASGYQGAAKGILGTALFLVERIDNWGAANHGEIINVWAGIVGRDGIEPDTFYTLETGKPVQTAR